MCWDHLGWHTGKTRPCLEYRFWATSLTSLDISYVEFPGYYLDFTIHHIYHQPHCMQISERLINHGKDPASIWSNSCSISVAERVTMTLLCSAQMNHLSNLIHQLNETFPHRARKRQKAEKGLKGWRFSIKTSIRQR